MSLRGVVVNLHEHLHLFRIELRERSADPKSPEDDPMSSHAAPRTQQRLTSKPSTSGIGFRLRTSGSF